MEIRKTLLGFSLIEVLIAVAIISIAALGFTKAQISSVKMAQDASLRDMATILADDMIARIQANAGEAWQYLSSGYKTGPATFNATCLDSTGGSCTGNQMALHDLYEWNKAITDNFPAWSGAVGYVCIEAIPVSTSQGCAAPPASQPAVVTYTIKLFWKTWDNQSSSIYDSVIVTATPPLQR